jgi:phosphatidylinositol alpha-mannosyltransferase
MKIGLICPYNIFKGGGVQECVLALQTELIKRGHEAKIITPWPRSYLGDEPENVIFLGASTDMKSPLHTTVQVSATGNRDRITEVLEAENFDILNFHEPWIPIISRQILAKSNSINVGTFHAKLPDTRMSKTIERVITPYTKSILKSLHHLTAVSESAADYVKQLTDAPITLVPNGIDLKKYKASPSSKTEEPTVLYVGRLEKRKGLKYLLRAFALLQETLPEARLIIAGDGPDREKLQELADDLMLNNIQFLGYIEEAEKLRLMQTSTVFCSPALYGESFGIVLLEAMASGTPVVAGANPGYAGVMQGRGELSLVNPLHIDEFARRLHLLLTDEGLRKSWCDWAHQYVKQFDYPKIVDQYEVIYQNVSEGTVNNHVLAEA